MKTPLCLLLFPLILAVSAAYIIGGDEEKKTDNKENSLWEKIELEKYRRHMEKMEERQSNRPLEMDEKLSRKNKTGIKIHENPSEIKKLIMKKPLKRHRRNAAAASTAQPTTISTTTEPCLTTASSDCGFTTESSDYDPDASTTEATTSDTTEDCTGTPDPDDGVVVSTTEPTTEDCTDTPDPDIDDGQVTGTTDDDHGVPTTVPTTEDGTDTPDPDSGDGTSTPDPDSGDKTATPDPDSEESTETSDPTIADPYFTVETPDPSAEDTEETTDPDPYFTEPAKQTTADPSTEDVDDTTDADGGKETPDPDPDDGKKTTDSLPDDLKSTTDPQMDRSTTTTDPVIDKVDTTTEAIIKDLDTTTDDQDTTTDPFTEDWDTTTYDPFTADLDTTRDSYTDDWDTTTDDSDQDTTETTTALVDTSDTTTQDPLITTKPPHKICAWSHWGSWTKCDCRDGVRSRIRKLKKPVDDCKIVGCGREVKKCDRFPCPIDCVPSQWSSWSVCKGSCYGVGTRKRHRYIRVPALYGGRRCRGGFHEYQECHDETLECGGGCAVGEWQAWNECQVPDGFPSCNCDQYNQQFVLIGQQTRRRVITGQVTDQCPSLFDVQPCDYTCC